MSNEHNSSTFIQKLEGWIANDRTKKKAVEYFREWGDKFWLDTSEHFQELTEKLSKDLSASIKPKFPLVEVSLGGARNLTTETKTEIKSLATKVVDSIQIQKLSEVLSLLQENAFTDRQQRYYILIDKLDEDWAETDTRCRFIRALIEETKSMRKIKQVKVISAIRRDLLDLIFNRTRDSGFQEEKYDAYLTNLSWSDKDLSMILDKRVSEVYRRQYTKGEVRFTDVFPRDKAGGEQAIQYLIQRTFLRPRDAIQFANECFSVAYERERISWNAMTSAEVIYSDKRQKSLVEEWSEFYPSLNTTMELVRYMEPSFSKSAIQQKAIEEVAGELGVKSNKDPCTIISKKMFEPSGKTTESDFVIECLKCLYHVGVIGLKAKNNDSFIWSYKNEPRVTNSQVKRTEKFKVHKMFRHCLEIRERNFIL